MFGLRVPELLLLLALAVLLFGAKRLPALGAGVGDAIRGFRRAVRGADEAPAPAPAPEA